MSAVEADGMPVTQAEWIARGFPAHQWKAARRFALSLCPLSGRCHGDKRHCIHCGPVDRTCSDEGCLVHSGTTRCGKKIPTILGHRICAQEPDHDEGCFALQPEWHTHRRALRHE
jgi:hypothetical protein